MAYKQVAIVEPKPKETVIQRRREGGGKLGRDIGGVVGGVAGGVVGMASGGPAGAAVGAMGGTVAGANFGSMIGERIKPTREEKTAIDRRVNSQAPQMMQSDSTEKLKQSIMALQSQPPEVRQEYMKPLIEAYAMQAKQNQGGNGGMA